MTHLSPPHHARARRSDVAALAIAVIACLLFVSQPTAARQRTPRSSNGTQEAAATQAAVVVRWPGRAGVRRYRLQLATDEKFSDIVFDRAVEGRQYTLTELAPGVYYWRVAPAAAETSVFSKPERVTVSSTETVSRDAGTSPSPAAVVGPNLITIDEATGWRTAVGEVTKLVGAKLRAGSVTDFVGVTAGGRVFAVDGMNGVSLWNARTEADAPAGFAPVVIAAGEGGANILVGAGGGVRLLRGETGREAWRARLDGTAAAGSFADLDGDGADELIVATSNPAALYALAQETGRVISTVKLDAEVVGAPLSFTSRGSRGLLVTLRDGTVQARGRDLTPIGSIKLDTVLTTAPVMVTRGDITVVVVGSEAGLFALGFPEMKLLGRILSDNDPIQGRLASADIDGDGSAEIAMVTKAGRVAIVGTRDGTVRWHAEGATGADSASFADINRDGVLDVVVPGGSAFLLGFSGRDGSLLMRADEPGARVGNANERNRPVVLAQSPGGGLMLVAADLSGTGLRAIELAGTSRGSVKGESKVGP